MLIAVTSHAGERFRQRVRGSLDERAEIRAAVARSLEAGRIEPAERGAFLVRDCDHPGLLYVCRREADELLVITLWEEGDHATVPRRFTDALRSDDRRVG